MMSRTWRERLQRGRQVLLRLATEHGTPAALGWAVAVGVMCGVSPFYGLQSVMAIGLATLLGLNRAVTLLASNISLPPMAPVLIVASVQLGHWLQHGAWLPVSYDVIVSQGPLAFAADWLLGSVGVALVLSPPAGLAAFAAVRWYRGKTGAASATP